MTVFFSSVVKLDLAFYKATQTIILHALIFYFNFLVLMPKLVEKQKIALYILSLFATIIIALAILHLLNFSIRPLGEIHFKGEIFRSINEGEVINHDKIMRRDESSIFRVRNILRNSSSILIILLFSIVYRVVFQKIKEEKRKVNIENENLLSEMKFLKSQINPHFLFNAINNIYTLVHFKSDRAPSTLIKLSEMLRYMLYESNDSFVPIEKEISYIKSYVDMQQLKTEERQNIKVSFKVNDSSIKIPPLLLIPFIENSFKHCNITNTETEWINIYLIATKNNIKFNIENSISTTKISKDKTGGIGLVNVKRRLELIYPDNHLLNIDILPNKYSVSLNINIGI
jgi:hypothetical protein